MYIKYNLQNAFNVFMRKTLLIINVLLIITLLIITIQAIFDILN